MLEFIRELEEKIKQLEEGTKSHVEQSSKVNATLNIFNGAIQAYQDVINRLNAKSNPQPAVSEAVSDVVVTDEQSASE